MVQLKYLIYDGNALTSKKSIYAGLNKICIYLHKMY